MPEEKNRYVEACREFLLMRPHVESSEDGGTRRHWLPLEKPITASELQYDDGSVPACLPCARLACGFADDVRAGLCTCGANPPKQKDDDGTTTKDAAVADTTTEEEGGPRSR